MGYNGDVKKPTEQQQFEQWIREQVAFYSPHLGLALHRVTVENDNAETYLAITCTYPYLDPLIKYNTKAFANWAEGKMEPDRILHELCHIITDPLYCKSISRYVSQDEIKDEREKLTDTIAAIVRKFLPR